MNAAPPVDEVANAKLEREKQEEEQIITSICQALGVQLHEVCFHATRRCPFLPSTVQHTLTLDP